MALQLWKNSVFVRRLRCFPPITHSKGYSCSSDEEIKIRFEAWAAEHGKSYKTLEEKEKRFKIFKNKLRSIENHNSKVHDCCKRELTKLSDQTWDEIHLTYCRS